MEEPPWLRLRTHFEWKGKAMAEKVYLPPDATRGQNISKTKKGWRIVNPKLSRTFKATQEAKFKSKDGDDYIVFRILGRK